MLVVFFGNIGAIGDFNFDSDDASDADREIVRGERAEIAFDLRGKPEPEITVTNQDRNKEQPRDLDGENADSGKLGQTTTIVHNS